MKNNIRIRMVTGCICLAVLLGGCHRKTEPATEAEYVAETQQETEDPDLKGLNPEAKEIVSAIKAASKQPAFRVDSDMQLKLNGSFIKMETNVNSVIDIEQGENPEDLKMYMETTSDMDDETAIAYYQDGWYYTEDKKGKNKVEKSPEQVMNMVTDITALVVDAAEEIDDISVSQDGTRKVYTYTLPASVAESYLEKLTESAAVSDTELNGATVEVEALKLSSTIDEDGILVNQKLQITGDVKKAIFKIPAEGNISADFQKTNGIERELE